MIESRQQVTVRYAETDMMGVAYHGSFLPWFEIGRTTLLKEHGLPYRELEAAGAAAIQFEDQVFPKRCGHMEGKKVIPAEEMARVESLRG